MTLFFEKYHGAGNDFILCDDRAEILNLSASMIASLCDRHFGIGADGLILLRNKPGYDFEMLYYNSDGKAGTMCGNGGRCAVLFARELGITSASAVFMASDGKHEALIIGEQVKLSMGNVDEVMFDGTSYILDSGSPHYVTFVDDVKRVHVVNEGRRIRNSDPYREQGINVNFVSGSGQQLEMRTYERGVEDETLSCGTGTVAVAIAASLNAGSREGPEEWNIRAPGGDLKVSFVRQGNGFREVFLQGPSKFVFRGQTEIT
jgi:diaminopimelate epimerase